MFPRSAWERRTANLQFAIYIFQFAVPSPGARSLRTRAASLRSGGGSVACQTVLAEQHPCFAGPPRVRPPGSESQHEETKVLARKAPSFRRRDYMDTRPMDQGWLAAIAGAVTCYEIVTYNTCARNPFSRRVRPWWCRRPACLFGGRRDARATTAKPARFRRRHPRQYVQGRKNRQLGGWPILGFERRGSGEVGCGRPGLFPARQTRMSAPPE